MNSKKKLLVENFLVYGLGSIISKIVPLIMMPIVTRLMPNTEYYGINDMVGALSDFCVPLVMLGLYDAMFRMFFEREDENYRKEICATSFYIVVVNAIFVALILLLFRKSIANLLLGQEKYNFLIYFSVAIVFLSGINNILIAPIRMQNKRKVFLILNFITSIIGYCISIPLILKGYYLIALPLSLLLNMILQFIIYLKLSFKWFNIRSFNKKYIKELLKIGIPLVPLFISYWIFNSFDRIMIRQILGVGEVGIYSVGAKVSSISQLIYQAFSQGYSYFAFSTMKDKDNSETIGKVFETLLLVSFLALLFCMPFKKALFHILFEGAYERGEEVFQFLFISPLILMLFQILASQFLVIKQSYYTLIIISLGGICNIILNRSLIPKMGIIGAGYATFLSYTIVLIGTIVLVLRKKLIIISNKTMVCVGIMVLYISITLFQINYYITSIIVMAILYCFYRKDFAIVLNYLKESITKKRKE